MTKKIKITEIIGWYGMTAIITAYALASFLIIQPDSLTYQLLNLTGAIGVVVVSYSKKVMQSVVLNVFWVIIALAALLGLLIG